MPLFPLWLEEVDYAAREDRQLIRCLWDEGVLSTTDFKVTKRGIGANMSVDVAEGWAVVAAEDAHDGSYLVENDAAVNLVIGAAPGANSRYDLVVLRVYDTNVNIGDPSDSAALEVIAGVVSGAPAVPAIPDAAIPLAVIGPITPTTVTIGDGAQSGTNAAVSYVNAAAPLLLAGDRVRPGEARAYFGTICPNGWVWMNGQSTAGMPALIDLGYATVPDMRARTAVGLDNLGGVDAGRLDDANVLGGVGGSETITLTSVNQLPAHSHGVTDAGHSHGHAHTHPVDHDHGSVYSSGASNGHYHGVSIQSGGESNTHDHGTYGDYPVAAYVNNGGPTAGYQGVAGVGYTLFGIASTGPDRADHSHGVNGITQWDTPDHSHVVDLPAFVGASGAASTANTNAAATGITTQNAGASAAIENMPPYVLCNWIMRARA